MSIEAPNPNQDKSQAELRSALEAKLYSLEPILTTGLEEYEQALADGIFDDQDGEEIGSGEKRKLAIQNKLTTLVNRAEEMKKKLDSGEELPQEPVLDIESLKTEFTPFLEETWKIWNIDAEKIENAVIAPVIIDPKSEDYQARQTDIDTAKFGEFTINPETQNLDWEALKDKIFIPDLSAFVGKPLHEVAKYLIDTYADTHKIPGIEYWKFILENSDKAPAELNMTRLRSKIYFPNGINLKNGKYYFNFGSLVRSSSGRWCVPSADWCGSEWSRGTYWLGDRWRSGSRVVLLEI